MRLKSVFVLLLMQDMSSQAVPLKNGQIVPLAVLLLDARSFHVTLNSRLPDSRLHLLFCVRRTARLTWHLEQQSLGFVLVLGKSWSNSEANYIVCPCPRHTSGAGVDIHCSRGNGSPCAQRPPGDRALRCMARVRCVVGRWQGHHAFDFGSPTLAF